MEQDIIENNTVQETEKEREINVTQHVDIHIIAKIGAYLPRTLAYSYVYETKNKNIARNFLHLGLAQNTYLFHAKESLEIKTFPNNTFTTLYKKDFKNHKCEVINNYVMFWIEDESTLIVFQL